MRRITELIKISNKVKNIYSELDKKIEKFKKENNIDCIKNCGRCCCNEQVEMAILEFIPLAIMLYEKNMIKTALDRLNCNQKICILYHYDVSDKYNGYCTIYQYRGLLCRLFGFSSTLDKYNKPVYTSCKTIKNNFDINNNIIDIKKIPAIDEYYARLKDIAPNLCDKFYPVNIAIKLAIEKVMLIYYYDKSNNLLTYLFEILKENYFNEYNF